MYNFINNWKTTLAGAILAVLVAVQPIIESGNVDWGRVAFAALVALSGFLAKDADKTGVKE